MKVLVWTHDLLLQQFLHGLLQTMEGMQLAFAQELDSVAPDGKPGWVVALASEDPHAADLQSVLGHPWVNGIVRFRTGGSVSVRTSVEGPYAEQAGVVELPLPASLSEIVQSLSGALQPQSSSNEFEELFTPGGSDNNIPCPDCGSDSITKLFSTYAPQMGASSSAAPPMPACAGGCPNAGSCGMM